MFFQVTEASPVSRLTEAEWTSGRFWSVVVTLRLQLLQLMPSTRRREVVGLLAVEGDWVLMNAGRSGVYGPRSFSSVEGGVDVAFNEAGDSANRLGQTGRTVEARKWQGVGDQGVRRHGRR